VTPRHNLERTSGYLLLAASVLVIHLLAEAANTTARSSAPFLSQPCYVGVKGLVKWPGIYGFKSPPTLQQAIKRAGGTLKDLSIFWPFGRTDSLCSNTVTVSAFSAHKAVLRFKRIDAFKRITLGLKIDINSEPPTGLTAIPGIGKRTAQAIVAFRERRGCIASLAQLARIPGIGAKTAVMLSRFIIVGTENCPSK